MVAHATHIVLATSVNVQLDILELIARHDSLLTFAMLTHVTMAALAKRKAKFKTNTQSCVSVRLDLLVQDVKLVYR